MHPPAGETAAVKARWRRQLRAVWSGMSTEELRRISVRALGFFFALPLWRRAETIMAYLHLPCEVPTTTLIEAAWREAKTVAVPLVRNDGLMHAQRLRAWSHCTVGLYGVRQPSDEPSGRIAPADLDVIVVPGLAFSRQGHRLGRGGGYYDRFLASLPERVARVAVVPSCVVLDALPAVDHDERVDLIFTEQGVLNCRRG